VPDPVLRQAYIVPFKGKATVILGYNGVIDLARNAEPGLEVRTGVIYDNDDYVYRDGLEPVFEVSRYHWHKGESPGDLVFSYCIYRLPHQQKPTMVVVPRHKLDAIAASKHKSPWNDPDSFPAMCEKTAIKRAAKLWTLSPNKKETVAFREAINRIDEADPADLPAAPGGDEFAGFGDLPEGERAIGTVAPVNAPPMDSERKPVQSRLI
jgi:recombinational DNA repair protein RecT